MQDKIYELEQERGLKRILGADEKIWECSKALFNFLKYTGLLYSVIYVFICHNYNYAKYMAP